MKIFNLSSCLIALSLSATVVSCHDYIDDNQNKNEQEQNQNQQFIQQNGSDLPILQFVYEQSRYYYLWNQNVPTRINLNNFKDAYELFESYRYSDDRFSAVIDNYTETLNQLNGQYLSDGLMIDLYIDDDDVHIIGIVKGVYKDSPADQAGMKRGNVITAINDTKLDFDNYIELLELNSCSYTYNQLYIGDDDQFLWDGEAQKSPVIDKIDLIVDPIQQYKLIEKNGKRISYLLYDEFNIDTTILDQTFQQIRDNQTEDLILDLRNNGGGYLTTCVKLASLLVPDGNDENEFLKIKYNDLITELYGDESINFTKQSNKPAIKNLYILTSQGTASASEEIISGLLPYMDVTIIGDTTYGKYTTNFLLNYDGKTGFDSNGTPYSEWALYITVGACYNSANEINFKNGFAPDYYVKDTYIIPLGDENEPLLAKALELSAGTLAKKASSLPKGLEKPIATFGKPEILRNAVTIKN